MHGAPDTRADGGRPRGVVVTAQQLAADAGRELLAAGGSAADAAVAAAFALCVVDPSNCGVGGYGGFLVYAPAGADPLAVAFNTWMPARLDPSSLRRPGSLEPVVRGGLGVAPPAVVPGLLEAHSRFGRRPRAEVLAPAISLARDGFPVGRYLAWALDQHRRFGGALPGGDLDALFYPDGRPLPRGATLVQTDLAATLEAVRDHGADAVRTGPIAAAICDAVAAEGGVLAPDDLAQDRVSVEPPASTTFAGATVSGPDTAISGTGVLFQALNEIDPSRLGENRGRDYVDALADGLRRGWARRLAATGAPVDVPHTTHLGAAGPDGDLATLTFTHGPWFGADLIATGTGILLNAGANVLAPTATGTNAVTNMAPIVLATRHGTRHAFGAAGGPRIPALLLSAIVDIACFDARLESAVAAPHLSVRASDGTLEVEPGLLLDDDLAKSSLTLGDRDFGPICGITQTTDGGLVGVPDNRFEHGLAAV